MEDHKRRLVPTYTRVWRQSWLIRGIPNGPTFWRPIEGRAAVTFAVVLLAEWIILRRFHLNLGVATGMAIYLGVPGLAAWWATSARLGGKRLDRWLMDRLEYRFGPKRFDRFRAVPDPDVYDLGGGHSGKGRSTR